MVTDSITNASIPMPLAGNKDFSKKKRVNRSAKLKQCKLDARREQWLSQVKNNKEKVDDSRGGRGGENSPLERNESERSIEKLEIKPIGKSNEEDTVHHFSDSDSPSNSPNSHTSSVLSSKASGTTFTGSSSGSSSSSSGGSCSGSVAGEEDDEEEEDDGCLDDWEAVADALAADDKEQQQQQQQQNANAKLPSEHGNVASFIPKDLTEPKIEKAPRAPKSCRAWKPDDAFRPQSLPNLSKQLSFPMKSSRHGFGGGGAWNCQNVVSGPCSCPICCEDLDTTERNFSPCSCGFKLCLFCHKRILEEDGRCPGCRKHYDHEPVKGEATFEGGNLTIRLARSCSMVTRT